MARALLTASFALFYSIGVASLIYALILRFTGMSPSSDVSSHAQPS